jgi:PKD repeat protein
MSYGTLASDVIQSSTTGTPPQFNDGSGAQIGTLCRAWIQYNGSSQTIVGSFNVSSVTYTSTGQYTVNFTKAMPDTNYSAVISAYATSTFTNNVTQPQSFTTTSFGIVHYENTYTNSSLVTAAIFR